MLLQKNNVIISTTDLRAIYITALLYSVYILHTLYPPKALAALQNYTFILLASSY